MSYDYATLHNQPEQWRVLIIDQNSVVRQGLRAMIEDEDDLIVCAQAATNRDALEAVAAASPDLVIADLPLGDVNGLALMKSIRAGHKDLLFLVLSLHDDPRYAERVIQAGANGYLTKLEIGESLVVAIRSVLAGETYHSPTIRAGLAEAMN